MIVISVEGIIGAGKTTLVDELYRILTNEGYAVVIAEEPVKKWEDVGIFKLFYEDPIRYAYTFQTFVYKTRIDSLINAYKSQKDIDIIISERTPYTDRYVFMKTLREKLAPIEGKLYDEWCDVWDKLLPENLRNSAWLGLLLDTPVKICSDRIKNRNRPNEEVTEYYQDMLRESHKVFFGDNSPYEKCVIVDGELPPNDLNRMSGILEVVKYYDDE